MNMDDLYKVCPECEGEYRMEIERCADCGIPLVFPEEIARRNARELPALGILKALRTAPIPWARALADDLAARGIPYGIDRSQARSEGLLTLLVRRPDWGAAREVDAARERIEGPRYAEEGDSSAAAEEPNVLELPEPPSYKVCPRCGGEYRLDIEVCADCGDRLVWPDESAEEIPPSDPRRERVVRGEVLPHLLPPSDDLVCVCCRSLGVLERLARELDEEGIAHRVDPGPAVPSTWFACLYVLPEDGDAAALVDAECLGGVPIETVDPAELASCPGCGAPRYPSTVECSDCGIRLGENLTLIDRLCGHCGAVVFSGAGPRCPNCGTRLPES